MDIEKNDVRAKRNDSGESRVSVSCLTHDFETLGFEKGACRVPEVLVIVNYEHGRAHVPIVASGCVEAHCG